MPTVGQTLKRARLDQGRELNAVAAQTKINAKYLEAIEADDRKSLPSGFFYKSFVDQYARALELDTRVIGEEVDRMLSGDAPLPLPGVESVVARDVLPVKSKRRFPSLRLYSSTASLLLVVLVCSGVYVGWRESRTVGLKSLFDRVMVLRRPPVVQAKVDAPKVVAQKAEAPKIEEPKVEIPKAVEQAASGANPAPPPAAGYNVLLDLIAHEATWLSVSSDGKPVFSGVLKANETKSIGGKQYAKMRVGNAAGIDVRLNGKPVGPLGARGQVLVVLFTPDNFQIVAPVKDSDD